MAVLEEIQFTYRKSKSYDKLIRELVKGNPADQKLARFYLETKYSTFSPKKFLELVFPYIKDHKENATIPGLILGEDIGVAASQLNTVLLWQEILHELGISESDIVTNESNNNEES